MPLVIGKNIIQIHLSKAFLKKATTYNNLETQLKLRTTEISGKILSLFSQKKLSKGEKGKIISGEKECSEC